MKKIPLTQGKFALVDDEDYEYLKRWKWYAHKDRNTFYAARQTPQGGGKQKMIQMHAEIIGRKEGFVTDHINGNGLDNRRGNLRHATNRQNGQNLHVEKSSKYPGVSWSKSNTNWRATIRVRGKVKYLGGFVDELEAAQAYQAAVASL